MTLRWRSSAPSMQTLDASVTEAELLWQPSADAIERSNLTRYMRWLADERELAFDDYEALREWSVDSLSDFWQSIADYFDVQFDGEAQSVLAAHEMPGARWFEGTSVNYAEHIFRDRDPGEIAVRHQAEGGELGEITWGELATRVAAFAAGLRSLGVERGDRVVAYIPNSPGALIGFFAA